MSHRPKINRLLKMQELALHVNCTTKYKRQVFYIHVISSNFHQALLSVFKGRLGDVRDKDTAVERCECHIQDQHDKTECRLIVKMVCRHGVYTSSIDLEILIHAATEGVIKTYKLTYESVEVMHALFNKSAAKNTWTIGANTLRSFAEYFGANTEQLDISSEGGRTTFTSYTEKIMNGRGLHHQS